MYMFGVTRDDRTRRQPGLARVHGLPARRHRRAAAAAARGSPHPHADRRPVGRRRSSATTRSISTTILLLNAGHEATVHTTGNGVKAILESGLDPGGAVRRRRADRGDGRGVPALRRAAAHVHPLRAERRDARERHELPQGEVIGLMLGAANRDPARFAERRPLRPVPHRQRQCQLRRRHPFLHRRTAGPDRAAGGDEDAVRPAAGATVALNDRPPRTSTISMGSTGSTSAGDQPWAAALSPRVQGPLNSSGAAGRMQEPFGARSRCRSEPDYAVKTSATGP